MTRVSCVVLMLFLAGCCDTSFEPYNYDKAEDAKLKGKGYSIRLHGRQLKLEKKFQFPSD